MAMKRRPKNVTNQVYPLEQREFAYYRAADTSVQRKVGVPLIYWYEFITYVEDTTGTTGCYGSLILSLRQEMDMLLWLTARAQEELNKFIDDEEEA